MKNFTYKIFQQNKKIINRFIMITSVYFLMLFFQNPLFANPVEKFDWFWVFYEKEVSQNYNSMTVRPFFTEHKTQRMLFQGSLMPLYSRYKTKNRDESRGFFNFINSNDYTHKQGVKDYDLGIFPFLYYGNSPEKKDRYLMIWPFGGTLKSKLGMEKITTVLFPGVLLFVFFPPSAVFSFQTGFWLLASLIPLYASYNWRDYNAKALLWPLIQWGKSKKRNDLRILPFYAHNSKKNFYDNYSVLLLFNYGTTYFKNDVHKTLFIFPLFGRKWSKSDRLSSTTILWPFFSWGHDKRKGETSYNLPWPLVQILDSKKPRIKKRIFFPFYGKYEYEGNETFFITPLHFSLKTRKPNFNSEYYINFILFWYFKREYKKPDNYYGKSWRYFKFWPLFKVEYNDMGDCSFNLLSILPFRDPEGYEKLYTPFWSIFEYRKLRNGEKRIGLLLRTYFQRWDNNFIQIRIPFIFTFERNHNKLTELSIILSLFGYSNTEDGCYIRLFWIPVKIGEGDGIKVADSKNDSKASNEFDYLRYCYNPAAHIPPLRTFKVTCNF